MRLAIVTTHPIQYNAPLFRALAGRDGIEIRVFYSWEGTARQDDPEFGRTISWDIPLLDGYDWEMIPNRARDPGTHHFRGLDNPGMIPAIAAWGAGAVLVYGWAWKTHLGVMRHFKGRIPVLLRGDSTLLSATGPVWKRWLRRPVLFLGLISYSLYLIHIPIGGRVVNIGNRFGDGPWFELGLVAAGTIASRIFAVIFWRLFEAPFLKLSRRISLNQREV